MSARRVVLVTGAGQRVGQAIATHLGAEGWDVAAHFHGSEAGAQETVAAVAKAGGRGDAIRADLSSPDGPAALVAETVRRFGRLDALVNSAAGMTRTPFGEVSAAQFDAIIALNLRAPFLVAQAAAAVLPEGGAIVNIADHLAHEPWPGFAVHGISKAGVEAMTKHLAAALAPRLRVNAVAPGFVLAPPGTPERTVEAFVETTPLRRIGAPRDVAAAVAFLLAQPYITGHVLPVDGGRRARY